MSCVICVSSIDGMRLHTQRALLAKCVCAGYISAMRSIVIHRAIKFTFCATTADADDQQGQKKVIAYASWNRLETEPK